MVVLLPVVILLHFFVAMLLVQVPTPSIVSVAMLLVCDAYFLADPFRSPTLPLLAVIAFCMRYVFLVMRGLGHSLQIPCSVGNWLG